MGASYEGKPAQQARELLLSGETETDSGEKTRLVVAAHNLLVDVIAPRTIFSRQLAYLLAFLQKFEPHIHLISGWSTGGQAYFDFLHLFSPIKKESLPSLADAKMMLGRLVGLPCRTEASRLAQSRMSLAVLEALKSLASESSFDVFTCLKQSQPLPP